MPTGATRGDMSGDMSGDMNGAHERGDGHHSGGWEIGALAALPPVDGTGAGDSIPATDNPSLPPERWLRDDTVDELRDARARGGLARPVRDSSIPRPPLAEAPAQISSYRSARATTPPSVSRLFISIGAGAVIGLLIGILAALAIHPDHLPIPGL